MLLCYGFTQEEISNYKQSEHLFELYRDLYQNTPYCWKFNTRQRLFVQDILKYGYDEAIVRDKFRVKKAEGIKHEDLLTLWKKHLQEKQP